MSRTKLTQNSIAAGAINANTMFAADVVGPHSIANTSTYSVGELLVGGTILLDNTGVITGPSSITSTAFVGALTGNASGTAATVTTAAQPAITSLGTLTALNVTGAGVPLAVTSSNNTLPLKLVRSDTSSTAYLGTVGNALVLAPSSGTPGAYLTATGLGIGTTSPSSPLTVYTSVGPATQITQTTAGENAIRVIGSHASFTGNVLQPWTVRDSGSEYDLIECVTNNGSQVPFRIRGDGYTTIKSYGSSLPASLAFVNEVGTSAVISQGPASDNALRFNENGGERMRITAGGNVGIGVSAPLEKLHVQGDVGVGANGADSYIYFARDGGTTLGKIGRIAAGDLAIDTQGSTDIIFKDGGAENMRITDAGNVGIGTSAPATKLHVVGGVMLDGITAIGRYQTSYDSAGAEVLIDANASTPPMAWHIGGSEVARIHSNGYLDIGSDKRTPDCWDTKSIISCIRR